MFVTLSPKSECFFLVVDTPWASDIEGTSSVSKALFLQVGLKSLRVSIGKLPTQQKKYFMVLNISGHVQVKMVVKLRGQHIA